MQEEEDDEEETGGGCGGAKGERTSWTTQVKRTGLQHTATHSNTLQHWQLTVNTLVTR